MNKKELHLNYTIKSLNLYIENYIQSKKLHPDCRTQNFPYYISENITKFIIREIEKLNCINSKVGDLEIVNNNKIIKIEVKCFTSKGPSSFGPTESWNVLYFLDAIDFKNYNFKLYKINSNNIEFSKIKVNKNETFKNQSDTGRRPRICFNNLKKQLNNIEKIYEENILELFKIKKLDVTNNIILQIKNNLNNIDKIKLIEYIKTL